MAEYFLIVANGPFLPMAQIVALAKGRKILALDGAADRLKKMGIQPDILLGDFDSLEDPKAWGIHTQLHTPYMNDQGILIVPAEDQNQTDLKKAIDFSDTQSVAGIDIINATDGRFDHTIANLCLLKQKHKVHRPIILHTESQSLIFLKDEIFRIQAKVGESIGLFGFPEGVVTTKGLKFELNECTLKFTEKESIANELVATSASVYVKGEILLVGPLINRH